MVAPARVIAADRFRPAPDRRVGCSLHTGRPADIGGTPPRNIAVAGALIVCRLVLAHCWLALGACLIACVLGGWRSVGPQPSRGARPIIAPLGPWVIVSPVGRVLLLVGN